jgi:RNA polymerase sigma-70 factor (ECF subfamily)
VLLRVGASDVLRAVGEGRLLRTERGELRAHHRADMRMPVIADSVPEPGRGTLDHKAVEPSEVNWSAFYAGLHGFVAARVRNASDIDDLVHLILERAMSKSAGAEIHNAPGWLFGIARNAVADYFRAQARSLMTDADALDASAPLGGTDEERSEVLRCMEPLLATLPADSARLLRWADMEDRAMQAIADDLGITLTAAKSRVQRARKEFMKATRDCCAITVDARGRVTSLTPKNNSVAAECEPSGSCCPSDSKESS